MVHARARQGGGRKKAERKAGGRAGAEECRARKGKKELSRVALRERKGAHKDLKLNIIDFVKYMYKIFEATYLEYQVTKIPWNLVCRSDIRPLVKKIKKTEQISENITISAITV